MKVDDNKVTPIDPDSIANGVPIIHDFSKGGHESVPFLVYELDGDSSDTTSEGELSERLKQEVESMFEKRQEEQAKEEEERRKREEEEEERSERVRAARALARRLEQEAEVARQVADNAERGGGPVDFDELERGVGMEVDVAGSLPHGASADSFAAEGAGAGGGGDMDTSDEPEVAAGRGVEGGGVDESEDEEGENDSLGSCMSDDATRGDGWGYRKWKQSVQDSTSSSTTEEEPAAGAPATPAATMKSIVAGMDAPPEGQAFFFAVAGGAEDESPLASAAATHAVAVYKFNRGKNRG